MASLIARSSFIAFIVSAGAVSALGTPETCSNPQLSCQNTTAVSDLCCFNAPGGQLLQTQFWDTDPSTDHCDGTYDSNCDSSRAYTGIGSKLTAFGENDLVSYMNTYWKDSGGDDETFWEHEWAKHGTCISTLKPSCYSDYTSEQELIDFFQKTVDLFKTLDSYTWLSDAGIVPSSSATYTSADIQAALKKGFGYEVTIGCSSGALDEIWYSYDVKGSIQTGTFVPTSPDGSKSTCPSSGVQYPPKSGSAVSTTPGGGSSPTSTTSPAGSSPTSSPGSFSGSGYLQAYSSGSNQGCLISTGKWYVGGTCATYTASASGSGFTLKSSKGTCGVVSGAISCGSGVTATVFTASNGNLAYGGSSTFYASAIPSGSTQEAVYTGSESVSVEFEWQSV
ncbi:MAG: ribonuclease T2-like [Claussenomyces sp. TS43310]|nr:MAG: ribonuclease T2-like [Claussenomyces sp. TS43310]